MNIETATDISSLRHFKSRQDHIYLQLAMDALLPQLLSFPPHPEPAKPIPDSEYDKHIKNLVHLISTIPASKLTSGVPGGGDLLDVCLPSLCLRACLEFLTNNILAYRLLIRRKIRSHTSTHSSLTYMAPVASKRLPQYQIHSNLDQRYGRKCLTSCKALTSVKSDMQARIFCD